MSKGRLRHTAGMLKHKVLYCWPYRFKQAKAAKLREQYRQKAFELPPIEPAGPAEIEIHMLCGKGQLDMGIWASWSILRFLSDAVLYVHSDGTLTEEDFRTWKRVVPAVIFISRADADKAAEARISQIAPILYNWRCSYWSGPHVVDIHLFGNKDRLLILDSDVLCFHDPVEVRQLLADPKPSYRWNRDLRSCYCADTELINQIIGVSIPEAFNCGFCITPRWGPAEFEFIENVLRQFETDERIDLRHFWTSQTLHAICATQFAGSHAFSDDYAVSLGPTRQGAIMRHYAGIPAIRPRYFTEGVPRLLSGLDCIGKAR